MCVIQCTRDAREAVVVGNVDDFHRRFSALENTQVEFQIAFDPTHRFLERRTRTMLFRIERIERVPVGVLAIYVIPLHFCTVS